MKRLTADVAIMQQGDKPEDVMLWIKKNKHPNETNTVDVTEWQLPLVPGCLLIFTESPHGNGRYMIPIRLKDEVEHVHKLKLRKSKKRSKHDSKGKSR